ncbi:MAG: cell division protein FtsL [Deltaproteobacteria bacterium]|nr:cell division protein FtsL [Deltaproteobacteria bacterium]MBW2535810.1 cell division protein FtsL [Deltaproteobacteria bacterium]
MKARRFIVLWTLAVAATTSAFVVQLAVRGKTVDAGYRLGKIRSEQARLREIKRVLEAEVASYETPHRVEMVARTLLGMTPPPPERVIPLRAVSSRKATKPGKGKSSTKPASTGGKTKP